jgi:phage terminase Nu1 subunit (DNA packaging protein)
MKARLFVAALATIITLPVFAQANTPVVDQRQINQEQRIDQGIASGQLTQREANRLERGQARVDALENRAKSDGVVTARERARLQHAQNVESKRIYRQKHDRQRD